VAGLVIAGDLTVESASVVASHLGLSQNLIGLTIVAAGTSLPEIITAVVAARKGQNDMVVGGIVGTIIFNIFFALGVTAVIAPLPFKTDNLVDAIVLLAVTALLFIVMFIGKKHTLEK
jgi:cation:H+ antiporter